MSFCFTVLLLSSALHGQTFRELVAKHDCLRCHSAGNGQRAPEFHAIATRYRDDLQPYDVHLINAREVGELPDQGTRQLIVARIDQQFHVRVFDRLGKMVIDRSESSETDALQRVFRSPNFAMNADAGASFTQQPRLTDVDRKKQSRELKSLLSTHLRFSKSWSRQHLVETIKHGGKGNWKEISKGTSMPAFGKRLSDADAERLADGILGITKLKVMNQGLGSGTVTSNPAGINCTTVCEMTFDTPQTVTVTAVADAESRFDRWEGDATGSGSVTLTMNEDRSLRAWFEPSPAIPQIALVDMNPDKINDFLLANPKVNTPARFLDALPDDLEFEQNWILMTRSESLQTGIARYPRILLPSKDARNVFTIGLAPHVSFPGSHPDAIEYMQWDGVQKNFRFHEIVLAEIAAMSATLPDGTSVPTFPKRDRGVKIDDAKCFRCHSTRNVLNRGSLPGTTGVTPGTVPFKGKPNWDPYDSWGGMMPFNRDRVYQGSVEAAAVRTVFNPWTWSSEPAVRQVMERLQLQPAGVSSDNRIRRHPGGTYDGHIKYEFDGTNFPVLVEPAPEGEAGLDIRTNYEFNAKVSTSAPSNVVRDGPRVQLFDSVSPSDDEGRGVELFDILGGFDNKFNQERIADEVATHRIATGNIPVDVRPIALAISNRFVRLVKNNAGIYVLESDVPLTIPLGFFDARSGMPLNELRKNTEERTHTIPRRKADLQHRNLNRVSDPYLSDAPAGEANGLILEYGAATKEGTSTSIERLRQEVFRRDLGGFDGDITVMNNYLPGFYVDREDYGNSDYVTLYRYFLEPLGVSVDKWSMAVRGRSRSYAFADVFEGLRPYPTEIADATGASLVRDGLITDPNDSNQVIAAVNASLAASVLPDVNQVPTYTDIQRILNKACVECHGGLNYPPYSNYGTELDFSENDEPTTTDYFARFQRAYDHVVNRTAPSTPSLGPIYARITRAETQTTLMPFEGPPLSKADIETFRRWIVGGRPNTVGDPHIRTVDGVNYDFQAIGEFTFLRDVSFELQVRQAGVNTTGPLGPDAHSGLTSCVSINAGVAMRIGRTRVTYQPDLSGQPNPAGMQLRIDGQLFDVGKLPINLPSGRLLPTIAPGGIQVELPGGSVIVITPGWWDHQKIWYLNIDGRNIRATEGLMGVVAPGNWLPATSTGKLLGPRPEALVDRHRQLYHEFGKSWRVTDTNSLFDYADGTSTKNFVLEDWPTFNSGDPCKVPDGIIAGNSQAPQPPIPLEAATDICKDILDPDRRADAIKDVMTTGEPSFAKTYLIADLIERNKLPTPPTLIFPKDDSKELPESFDFRWQSSTDEDGDALTYRQYVWSSLETPNNNLAEKVPGSLARIQSKAVTKFQPGQTYYWKVIVEDGKGGTVESETRQFKVAPTK